MVAETIATKEFLVLTAAPESSYFSHQRLATCARALPSLPVVRRLSGDAVEYRINEATGDINQRICDYFEDEPVDINCVPCASRQKKMLVADLESTIIEQECLDELAVKIGKQDEVSDITDRAMRDELDFEPALKARVAMLAGLPEAALQELYDHGVSLMPGATTLLATLKAHHVTCLLVSGGFAFFAARISARLGFDHYQCNDLNITDGVLDGTVAEPILNRAAKAVVMEQWRIKLGLENNQIVAVGDGSNDLAMLTAAGMGVAFRAKPMVTQATHYRIEHGDLTALLYLQGYQKADFKTP